MLVAYTLARVAEGHGLHLLMIFIKDCYVHNIESSSLYILAWIADSYGLCLLIIFMGDRYPHNTECHSLIFWFGLRTVLGCVC